MASPQVENGYTKIANEILEALARIRIPGEAVQVLLIIIRLTYGFQKKKDSISLSQFYLKTGIAKSSIIRAIRTLEKLNLIYKKVNGTVTEYSINKDFETWKPFTKKSTFTFSSTNVYKKVKKRLLKSNPQKKKETITKENSAPEILNLSSLLADKMLANNPKHRSLNGEKESTIQKWADAIEKLHRIDKQTVEDIKTVIEWSQKDPFWKVNILSGEKLREKWDVLYLQAKEAKKNLRDSHSDPIDKLKKKMGIA
ncbi:MAG: replication protein [Nitrospirae bacterium]|nr:replication protein [Nitrospirota bacterium]